MTAGYMLRRDQALADRGEKLCECGHPLREHREKGYTYALGAHGMIVEVKHPDHRAGRSFCGINGCDCVLEVTA